MLICSNLMVSVVYILLCGESEKNVTHEAKGKIVHLFEPLWAKMPCDGGMKVSSNGLCLTKMAVIPIYGKNL